ncbi:hypothetical protein GBA52_028670 [Prunus armeniaca]|nr:hypothetical protein GBA52_028670 [Prunus armeniaca]
MADEAQYSSGPDSGNNKRKYEEQTTPPPRRATGFSAPITSSSPDSAPPSYSNVPPPVDDIQVAKQRAQEIAARLFNNASGGVAAAGLEAKRLGLRMALIPLTRALALFHLVRLLSLDLTCQTQLLHRSLYRMVASGLKQKIDVPNGRVGVIIGKGGETIKYLQTQSGAKIQVTRDGDADLSAPTRMVELMGTQSRSQRLSI